MASVRVTYRSEWAEGIIDTAAEVDLTTGEVINIEDASDEETAEVEIHIRDIIYYTDNKGGQCEMEVEQNEDNLYFISKNDLLYLSELVNHERCTYLDDLPEE